MDIERPVVLGRNEDDLRQKRNSILSFYVDQRKCQAFDLPVIRLFVGDFSFSILEIILIHI